MFRLSFSFLALVSVMGLHAQNALRDDLNGVYYDPTLYMQQYEIEDGSPYLEVEFQPAKIGDREKTYLVRFNAYKGNIEVWIKENQVIILNASGEERIQLLDGSKREYVITKYRNPENDKAEGFLQVIRSTEGYTLYKKEVIQYFKKKKAEGYAAAKPARFEKARPQFYLKPSGSDKMPIYLPSNKGKFLGVFGSKNAVKAKTLIKKERLRLNKEEDIIRILDTIYGQ
jgi:hypothetical protein